MRLLDKVSIITGSANGIGLATALKFAAEGAIVVVTDLKQTAIDAALSQVQQVAHPNAAKAIGLVLDVTQRAQIDAVVSQVQARLGRIDVLVNNAGIVMDARLVKMTEAQFDKVIEINLKGTYLCAQAVADIMIAQAKGVILNASSVVGLYGNFGQTNYAASKAGVIAFARTWGRELGAKGVRCNAVCPGFVETHILDAIPEKILEQMRLKVPLQRLAKAEEIANVYAFLASDEASYINGAFIEVDGGMTL